jgi:hypothetical protein
VLHGGRRSARLAQKPAADQQAGEEQQPAKPDALRTAVSMQVLTELCELSGPFSAVLARLRHELVASIYSPYYDAAEGSMMYTQTPFFVVVDRLEREKAALQSEQEQLREEMLERLDTVTAIEERMALLETGVSAERARNEELVAEADGIAEQLERALAEGSLCKQELKRLREEYGVMQEDLVRLHVGYSFATIAYETAVCAMTLYVAGPVAYDAGGQCSRRTPFRTTPPFAVA